MIHAALVADGVRAARYTSPHLVDLAERFVIGFDPIDAPALEAAAQDVLDCSEQLQAEGVLSVHPTFFEATTAIGFELFRRAHVEVAVIEVGLGGTIRRDQRALAAGRVSSPRSASIISSTSATRSMRSPSKRPASSNRA